MLMGHGHAIAKGGCLTWVAISEKGLLLVTAYSTWASAVLQVLARYNLKFLLLLLFLLFTVMDNFGSKMLSTKLFGLPKATIEIFRM